MVADIIVIVVVMAVTKEMKMIRSNTANEWQCKQFRTGTKRVLQ